jgi:hypothetical protein
LADISAIQYRLELIGLSGSIVHLSRRFRAGDRNNIGKHDYDAMRSSHNSRRRQIAIALQRRHVMRALIVAVTALATVSIAGTALAQQQQRSVRDMMNDMKARYGQTFEQCQSLATSRGYRLSDDEYEGRLVMMFIEGCIMGKQR